MKKLLSFLTATGLSLVLATSAFAATNLTDINGPECYAKADIQYLVDQGIVNGYEDNTFRPTKDINREEFAKLLCLAMDLPLDADASAVFTDVEDWARPYVGALVNADLTSGKTSNTYGATDNLTREEMATFFIRAMGLEDRAATLLTDEIIQNSFNDAAQVQDYAKANVALSQALGFIKGDGTNFNPGANAERQAVAALVCRYMTKFDSVYLPELIKLELGQPIEGVPEYLTAPTEVTMNGDGNYVVAFGDSNGALMQDEMTFTKDEVISSIYTIYPAYRIFLGAGMDQAIWNSDANSKGVFAVTMALTWSLENSGVQFVDGVTESETALSDFITAIDNYLADPAHAGAKLDEPTIIQIATDCGILKAQQ